MSDYTHFLVPSESHQVVGQRRHEKRFQRLLSEFKSGKLDTNVVLITSAPGFGKSSLLKVFTEIAQSEIIPCSKIEPKMGRGNRLFFRELYESIRPYLKEAKKGFFKKPKELSIDEFSPKSSIDKIKDKFISNFTIRPFKEPVIVIYDPVDRIIESGQIYVLNGLSQLVKVFKEKNIPLLFIFAVQDRNLDEIKPLFDKIETFTLDRLDFSEAKLLLSKVGSALTIEVLRKEANLRDDLVKQSDRSPFNLMFIAEVVRWAEDKLKVENKNVNVAAVKDLATPFIRNFAVRQFLIETIHLSEKEQELLQILSSGPKNAVPLETLQSSGIQMNTIEDLVEKGLIILQNEFVQFVSYALHDKMSSRLGSVDLTAEAELLLQILEADLLSGVSINRKVFDRLEMASLSDQRLEDQSIPNRVAGLYQTAIEKGKFYDAYRLAILAGNFLQLANNDEGAAIFFEECANRFRDLGDEKLHYTLALYKRAIESSRAVKAADRKIRDMSQRMAMLYLQLAEKHERAKEIGIARAYYYQAVRYFEIAEEWTSVKNVARKARNTYDTKKPSLGNFFKRIELEMSGGGS